MKKDIIKIKICNYSYNLENEEYVNSILSISPAGNILKHIIKILKSNNIDDMQEAMLFTRDISNGSISQKISEIFRKDIPSSGLFEELNNLLYYKNYFIRSSAIYTFGKICFKENSKFLSEAFNYCLKKDPLNILKLIFELFWLGDRNKIYIHTLCTHKNYLFRLAGLETLERLTPDESKDILSRLANDENEYVKQRVKDIKEGKCSSLDFDIITTKFTNHLYQTAREDYTIDELHNFTKNII